MPGPQLLPVNAAAPGHRLIQFLLYGGKTVAGKGVHLVHKQFHLPGLLSAEHQAHRVIIGESEGIRQLIAQPHDLQDIACHLPAHRLVRLPDIPEFRRVRGSAQQPLHLIVIDPAAAEIRPESSILPLEDRLLLNDSPQQGPVGLPGEETVVQLIQLPPQQRLRNAPGLLDPVQLLKGPAV